MRYQVWQPVKVNNEKHPLNGQAGAVHTVSENFPDFVSVKFDAPESIQWVNVSDLQAL
jgi:hypothetical protein